MKKLFLLLILTFLTQFINAQSYIQVTGEPNLSVYLNNVFKAKTTAEFNGCIIENVQSGINVIKIEKTGYAAYEESINIKKGEVFAYKVKPFTKHSVYVSEQGNSAVTEKKEVLETGKLIIQSVPIEIKITISDIDGINNSSKTKDEWIADEIPAGNYKVTFTYNQKSISKNISVLGNETTNVFVNMMSSEVKTSNTIDEKTGVLEFIDNLCALYKFVPGTERDFRENNTEASNILKRIEYNSYGDKFCYPENKKEEYGKINPYSLSIINGKARYKLEMKVLLNDNPEIVQNYFTKLLDEVKSKISPKYYKYSVTEYGRQILAIIDPNDVCYIGISFSTTNLKAKNSYSSIEIEFQSW